MKIGRREFRPAWWSALLAASGITLFVILGMWQLDRAAFKDSVQQKFEQRLTLNYRMLNIDTDLDDIQYRKLVVRGSYDNAHNFLLDNQVHQGQAGYQVLTPLLLADSDHIILVNRGWAAWGATRERLPEILPAEQAGAVEGIAFVPGEPALSLGGLRLSEGWPQLIPYVDLEALRQQYSQRLLPMILWLAPDGPGVYVRDWDPIWLPPEKSRAYAVQWFSFAALALLLFVLLNLRKTE
ncbi:MAG: SURF1 family protein [Gammaproteobacteria bacterium]|nr:SURF1 family protein [Gammaproteobacteria bacterium]MDH3534262.1 SURF1 family protein [Gammaproteobacteria bacterium]